MMLAGMNMLTHFLRTACCVCVCGRVHACLCERMALAASSSAELSRASSLVRQMRPKPVHIYVLACAYFELSGGDGSC